MIRDQNNPNSEIQNGLHETFHENGQVKIRYYKKNGIPHGFWEYYYENGQLSVKHNFNNGEQ